MQQTITVAMVGHLMLDSVGTINKPANFQLG
jgi:hypothetical protein